MSKEVLDYRATGAYSAVVEFVAQMHHDFRSGPMADMSVLPGEVDDLSEDDDDPSGMFTRELTSHESFPDMVEEACEVVGYASGFLPYITALLHSAGNDGLLVDPIDVVASEYTQALGVAIDPEKLEDVRIKLRDGGPVLGMLSLNQREYRYAIVKHLKNKREGVTACVDYSWQQHNAVREIKALETEGLSLSTMHKLAKNLFESKKAPRRLTVGMVRTLTGCDSAQAEMQLEAYEVLPLAPRG